MGVKIGRPQKLMCHMMSDPYHVMGKVTCQSSLSSVFGQLAGLYDTEQ